MSAFALRRRLLGQTDPVIVPEPNDPNDSPRTRQTRSSQTRAKQTEVSSLPLPEPTNSDGTSPDVLALAPASKPVRYDPVVTRPERRFDVTKPSPRPGRGQAEWPARPALNLQAHQKKLPREEGRDDRLKATRGRGTRQRPAPCEADADRCRGSSSSAATVSV